MPVAVTEPLTETVGVPVKHAVVDTDAVEEGEEDAVEVGDAVEEVEAEAVEDMDAEADFVEEEEPDAVEVGLAEPVVVAVDVTEAELVSHEQGVDVALEDVEGVDEVEKVSYSVAGVVAVMVTVSVLKGEKDSEAVADTG